MVVFGMRVCLVGVLGLFKIGMNGVAFGISVGCPVVFIIIFILLRMVSTVVCNVDISVSDRGPVICLDWFLFGSGF